MPSYERTFCSSCKAYSVHEDGVCMHHEEKCFECESPIKSEQGRYRMSQRLTYCETCGDKRIAPRFVL